MPSWTDVRHHVSERFSVAGGGDDWLALTWTFPRSDGDPVTQRQRIGLAHASGRPHLIVLCDVVAYERADLEDALRHNARLSAGALALLEDTLVLRSCRDLEHLELVDLDRSLEAIAHEAARLRVRVAGGPEIADVVDAVAHWI